MPPFLSVEPKVILAIIGFIAFAVLIVVLLCRHYNNADGSADWEAVGKTIMILLFWWGGDFCHRRQGHH